MINDNFNKKDHIKKCQQYVDSLINFLQKHNIKFIGGDGELNNVVFRKDNKTYKISYHCFYRFSGLCKKIKTLKKVKGVEYIEFIPINMNEYINEYMKAIILNYFK